MSTTKIFELKVYLDESFQVKGQSGQATMVLFHGTVDSEWFHGKVLPSAVDTQTEWPGETWKVSARYILEGTDKAGNPCRIFIENNGGISEATKQIRTTPRILTDSPVLQWLETADLFGTVDGKEEYILIQIYQNV